MRSYRLLTALTAVLATACSESSGPSEPSDPSATRHHGFIVADETWRAAASPHVVQGLVAVESGATLTIEAGATVLFEPGSGLTVGWSRSSGTLRAIGSATAPITMRGAAAAPTPGDWSGVRVRDGSSAELVHVSLRDCGGVFFSDSIPGTCVAAGNPFRADEFATVSLQDVTIEDGRGGGIGLWHQAAFAEGSARLTVRNMRGHIARMRGREAARFPLGGTFSGNDTSEVRLDADVIATSMTLSPGVPWAVVGDLHVEGVGTPVLSISSGSTIRLDAALRIGSSAPGGLQVGAPGGTLTSLLPRASRWDGVDFRKFAVSSFLHNTRLEACGTIGGPCMYMVGDFDGNGPAPRPLLRDVTILNAVGGGLTMTYGGGPAEGSSNLTITGTSGAPLFAASTLVSAIPSGQYTGNEADEIRLNGYTQRADDAWPNRGVPYVLMGSVSVGDSTNRPTLTIAPGVTVKSAIGAAINIGDGRPGALRAIGTAAAPITFTSRVAGPGNWVGIQLKHQADSSTMLEHVIIENAGGADYFGSLYFYKDLGPILRNSIIRNSRNCAIGIINGPPWATDLMAPELGNTFVNNPDGAVCGP